MNEDALVVTPQQEHALTEWSGAADRGLRARTERGKIIGRVLEEGVHYGTIPGTQKPTLYKPGAEAVCDSLNLYPDYESVGNLEDFEKGVFFYRYRCRLKQRGSDAVVSTGIGSCNSMEERYRWRKAERTCPTCSKPAIIKGKAEYGGGFVCFKKKGGCGAKFKDADPAILEQPAGRVPNDDPYTLINTIDKMAQKRALVAAALNLGFSQQFTQDAEDLGAQAGTHDQPPPPPAEEHPPAARPPKSDGEAHHEKDETIISAAQIKRLWAKAYSATETKEQAQEVVGAAIGGYGYEKTSEIRTVHYDPICKAIEP